MGEKHRISTGYVYSIILNLNQTWLMRSDLKTLSNKQDELFITLIKWYAASWLNKYLFEAEYKISLLESIWIWKATKQK